MPRVPRRAVKASPPPLTNLVQLFPQAPAAPPPAKPSPASLRDIYEWRMFGESLPSEHLAAVVEVLPERAEHIALLTEWMTLGASMPLAQLAVVLSSARRAAALSVHA